MAGTIATSSVFKRVIDSPVLKLSVVTLLAFFYLASFYHFKANGRNFITHYNLTKVTQVEIPEKIFVNLNSNFAEKVVLSGDWSYSEPWGTWTMGNTHKLAFRVDPSLVGQRIALQFKFVRAAATPINTPLRASIYADGKRIEKWEFHKDGHHPKSVEVSLKHPDGALILELRVENPVSPSQVSDSGDNRKLGLGIESLSLSHVSNE